MGTTKLEKNEVRVEVLMLLLAGPKAYVKLGKRV